MKCDQWSTSLMMQECLKFFNSLPWAYSCPSGAPVLHNCFTLHVLLQVRTLNNINIRLISKYNKTECCVSSCRSKDGLKGFAFSALKWVGHIPASALADLLALSESVVSLSPSGSLLGKRRFPLMASRLSTAARGCPRGQSEPSRQTTLR